MPKRKMPKRTKKWPKPEAVAAKHKPKWEPLEATPDDASAPAAARPDEVSPELHELRRKFLGADAEHVSMPADGAPMALVPMVPKARTDGPSPGAKRLVVRGEDVIGEQG